MTISKIKTFSVVTHYKGPPSQKKDVIM